MATTSPSSGAGSRPPQPTKGILKRPSARSNPSKTKNLVSRLQAADEQQQSPSTKEQERQTTSLLEQAVKQAEILQRLKESGDIREPVPLEVFERLSQFPILRSPEYSASNPSTQDAAEFISAVEKFIPSEYDDLIEERNILGNCGYTLCPRPRRSYVGEWKIHTTGIARSADLNRWCSEKCAVRALHIKVQLDNPTYVRRRDLSVGGGGKVITVTKIELREEDRPREQQARLEETKAGEQTQQNGQTKAPQPADADVTMKDEEPAADGASKSFITPSRKAALEAERIGGRPGTGLSTEKHSAAAEAAANLQLNLPVRTREKQIEVTIREKDTTEGSAQPPDPRTASAGDVVEGYKIGSKFDLKKKKKSKDGGEATASKEGEDSDEVDDDDADDFFSLRF